MSLISLIVALLLEQWRPLADRKQLVSRAERFADFLQQHFNAGERAHGVIAWVLGVVPAMLLVLLAYYLLYRVSPLLALGLNVAHTLRDYGVPPGWPLFHRHPLGAQER